MDQKDIDVLPYHTQINHYTLLTLCGLSETEQSVTECDVYQMSRASTS